MRGGGRGVPSLAPFRSSVNARRPALAPAARSPPLRPLSPLCARRPRRARPDRPCELASARVGRLRDAAARGRAARRRAAEGLLYRRRRGHRCVRLVGTVMDCNASSSVTARASVRAHPAPVRSDRTSRAAPRASRERASHPRVAVVRLTRAGRRTHFSSPRLPRSLARSVNSIVRFCAYVLTRAGRRTLLHVLAAPAARRRGARSLARSLARSVAGKGRQLAGLITDQWCAGNKRHVWVSVSTDLKLDAERDLSDLGLGDEVGVFCLSMMMVG